ncbi:MAG: hypothetical protein KUG79_16080 [Pseudomonadales bacterium]|nr:hypothetical protein [Pseudomonadales bacterium]
MKTILLLLFALIISIQQSSADPWVLEQGQQSFSVLYVTETFDEIWIKGDELHIDFPDVDQQTYWLQYSYGFTDSLTLEVGTGRTRSEMDGKQKKFSGRADSQVTLSWQVFNEYQGSPVTLAVHFGATLHGSYDRSSAGNPHSPGNRANGVETSVSIAKAINNYIAFSTEIGYRHRYQDVPEEIFYRFGILSSITPTLAMSLRYRHVDSRSHLDIMGPGFSPDRFHETEEDISGLSLDANWQLGQGHSLFLGTARVLDGKNTGESEIYFFGYSFTL